MILSLDGQYQETVNWCRSSFRRDYDPIAVIEELKKGITVLEKEVEAHEKGWRRDRESLILSASEVQVKLWKLMVRYGVCSNSFSDHIMLSLRINKKRTLVDEKDNINP